jgi:hypothetical protein
MKHHSIETTLTRLSEALGAGAFAVIDHWEDDEFAVGVAHPQHQAQLVYITTFEMPKDSYFVVFEKAPNPDSDLPYTDEGDDVAESFEELVEMIQKHLGI